MKTTTVTQQTTANTKVSNEDKPYLVVHQIMDFVLSLIEGFLALDFILLMTGANRGAGFFQLVDGITDFFMIPFRYIFPVSSAGGSVIDWSIIIAMFVYALAFYAFRKAIAVIYTADTA